MARKGEQTIATKNERKSSKRLQYFDIICGNLNFVNSKLL